ncbi:ATP-dependent zinc metalloprotease YME1L1-like [Dysidea avara]|uniref:ATP-dependent zinc metalloprotease YME1L1-like n=1 Tax=Dysidea avara TaxID=196820 RepID=UPI003326516D
MDTVQESELGSKENPMTVSVIPKKHGVISEMWSLFRTLGVILVLLGLFSSSMVAKIRSGASQMVGDFQPNVGEKTYTFEDVQGVDEAKDELREVVEFLKNPERFQKLGARLPRGILLVGPPGTGKTLLAKAISGEAEVPFYFCSGSEFDEMFVGVGASRMRQLFEKARKNKPCVLFIDELDAVGGARIASSLHPYSRMTLNQLLVEMDGFKELDGIIIIGATNFPESLDKALIRAGRFDTRINTTLPDVRARHKILQVHAAKVKLHLEMDLETVARTTTGFSGADLANLVNQAALRGSADGKDAVTMKDFDWARDKIIMGAERKNAVIAEENRRLVAYHEAGHAVVALWTPGAMKVYKATIVPRGSALGMVAQLPEKDELHWSRKQLLARMDVAMGGRVAEEMVFGAENVTSGASSDVEVASRLARTMITRYAMSDVVGPVAPMEDEKTSPEMSNLIEQEVKRFTKEAYERAKHVLQTHTVEHKRLAEALLKYETLDLEEIKLVVQGKPLDRSL